MLVYAGCEGAGSFAGGRSSLAVMLVFFSRGVHNFIETPGFFLANL